MSERVAIRLVCAVAFALAMAGIVGALSLALRTAHVWPGCLVGAAFGLVNGYLTGGLICRDRSRS